MYKRLLNKYYSFRQQCLEWKFNRGAASSVIDGVCLMAHHVSDVYVPNTPNTCQCTIATFQDCIAKYVADGYKFVTMSEAMELISERSRRKFALLTFDDVPDNMYTNAFPYLKEHRIPFTLFLSPIYIDTPGYLSVVQINELIRSGLCTIGAHTMSHSMLRYTPNKEYEIKESKDVLASLFNIPIDYFAYPYGSMMAVDGESRRIAEREFKAAFSTIYSGINDTSSKDNWFLPRKHL